MAQFKSIGHTPRTLLTGFVARSDGEFHPALAIRDDESPTGGGPMVILSEEAALAVAHKLLTYVTERQQKRGAAQG